jgi:uncharacterized membrane protein SpoIIM required for sporulation/ABC-type transport system involved in multi-copper enzyme maturation permease subunit
MLNEFQPAFLIARREIRDQFRDWRIIFPILGLTIFFPFLMNFTARQILDFVQRYGANIIGERMVPFLLMVVGFFPISVSLVIALETFVGEKERGSIEPLLNTPLKDWQLYLGKLLSATVYPVLSSYIGMGFYLTALYLNGVTLPPTSVLFLVVVLTTVQALVMVTGAVVVSSQATSVRAANLLASFIIIPVALLIQGESVVMFWGSYDSLWWVVFGLIVLGLLLARVGLVHFQREELLGREIDVLNVKWIWRVFRNGFTRDAKSFWVWWRKLFPETFRELKRSIVFVAVIMLVAVLIGVLETQNYFVPLGQSGIQGMNSQIKSLVKNWPIFSIMPVLAIWWQNVRVLLLAFILGSFSFGILGVIPMVATMFVAGYLFGLLTGNGLSALSYLAFILPHGIVEIPAAILATAAIVQVGVILATPIPDKTIGEIWINALAGWARVMVGIVMPLLLIGACIEAWVTPRIALYFFH